MVSAPHGAGTQGCSQGHALLQAEDSVNWRGKVEMQFKINWIIPEVGDIKS